jgi:hypothetical protein
LLRAGRTDLGITFLRESVSYCRRLSAVVRRFDPAAAVCRLASLAGPAGSDEFFGFDGLGSRLGFKPGVELVAECGVSLDHFDDGLLALFWEVAVGEFEGCGDPADEVDAWPCSISTSDDAGEVGGVEIDELGQLSLAEASLLEENGEFVVEWPICAAG